MSGQSCGRCRKPLPAGTAFCPSCQTGIRRWRREATLIIALLAIGVVLFSATWFLTHAFEDRRQKLAEQWFAAGQQSLSDGQPQQAISDLRSALYYHDNDLYRLRLAEALAAANYADQAKAYLLNLWEERPGSANINLELARVAAQQHDTADAIRYYHGAIFGVWDGNAIEHRLQTRLELIRFLIHQNSIPAAYAETTSLAASVPLSDPQMRTVTGDLFARTGDFGGALTQYQAALKSDPRLFAALSGAARASFASGEYRRAKQYVEEALREKPEDAELSTLLQQTNLILDSDPLEHYLSRGQRMQRAMNAFNQAGQRLQQCGALASSGNLAAHGGGTRSVGSSTVNSQSRDDLSALASEWSNLRPNINPRSMTRNPDLVDNSMEIVFRIEQAATKSCGTPTGLDWALLQLANHGSGVEH
jgi:tetratricopeptide (TPR) repeat protein